MTDSGRLAIPENTHESGSAGEPRLLSAALAFVILATFAYFIAIGALLPTVPRYAADELGASGLGVGIAVGSFAVSAALLRPWIGRLGDVYGRRILVMGGCLVAGVSILAYPLATSLPALVAARLVSGVGEAAVFTGAATAAQDLAPDHRRGEAISYFSVALYGGIAVGPLLGEALRKATDFTTVFVVFGLCALIAALLATKVPVGRLTQGRRRSRDLAGRRREPAHLSEHPDGQSGEPAGRRLLLYRSALGPGTILLLGLIPFTAFSAFLPLYAEQVGLADVGPVFALYAGLVLVVRIFGAKLPDILGWRRGSSLALLGVMTGAAITGLWASSAAVWIGAVALGVGMSLLFPALFMAVVGRTPLGERTHAIGTFTLFFDLSQGLGAAFVGGVVSLTSERGGFVAAALCALVGLAAHRALSSRIGTGLDDPAAGRRPVRRPAG